MDAPVWNQTMNSMLKDPNCCFD